MSASLMSLSLPEPPTTTSLHAARERLASDGAALSDLQIRIAAAERKLAETIAEQRAAIHALQTEHAELRRTVECTRGYLAPIKRLPRELLQEVFLWNWEEQPCVGWVLSSICRLWRRTALGMPTLWTKIRLVTTPSSSPDTIRLWLERAGPSLPLDIEIFLRVARPQQKRRTPQLLPLMNPGPAHYQAPSEPNELGLLVDEDEQHVDDMPGLEDVPVTPTLPQTQQSTWVWLPASAGTLPPPSPTFFPPSPVPAGWHAPPPPLPPYRRSSRYQPADDGSAWGHVAIYYLTAQMARWERFIFRFDKQFSSWTALKTISGGHAPLLREFEVACAEAAYYGECPWLPSASSTTPVSLPALRRVTLGNAPFKWNSPMLRPNLTALSLRALPSGNIALDRVLSLARSNPHLEELDLHFLNVLPAVLPLAQLTLPHLHTLSLGGHYTLSALLDTLVLPALGTLALDIEARDPFDDHLAQLFQRSQSPPLHTLSLGYAVSAHGGPPYYYNAGGLVSGWTWLEHCDSLTTLRVGSAPLEPLVASLGAPDDEDEDQMPPGLGGGTDEWLCPKLTTLALKSCPAHPDGVPKLVHLVEKRNPPMNTHSSSGGSHSHGVEIARLKRLEMIECASVGADVVAWIKERVDEVMCIESPFDRRRPSSPSYAYV
ncbi:hypothetical protein PENSPDRAFT_646159 [Peniophora sp. CONT]|nr:hypothetical protein PENSPDRAFT_646159 [Peniophora sp. CONT]